VGWPAAFVRLPLSRELRTSEGTGEWGSMAALETWGHAGVMSGGEVWRTPEHAILVDPPLISVQH
jgi:hypothetical protein